MTRLAQFALVAALALVAGCSTPPNLAGGSGSGIGGPNDPSNPTSVAYFQTEVGDRVLFEVDQSVLTDTARQILNGQVTWLMANTGYAATVEGHADEQGTREYNLALGARRANAVYEYLVSRGVPSNRLRTVSFGKERPIEICSTEVCYAQNRRAITIITPSAGV